MYDYHNWLELTPKLQTREKEKQISLVHNYYTFNSIQMTLKLKPSSEYFQHKTPENW